MSKRRIISALIVIAFSIAYGLHVNTTPVVSAKAVSATEPYSVTLISEIDERIDSLNETLDDLILSAEEITEQKELENPYNSEVPEFYILTDLEATAYTLECGTGDGITASGTRVREGRTIAVDPNLIPIGSVVFIPGLGWRIAEDVGYAVKGKVIDIYVGSGDTALEKAKAFGRQKIAKIYVFRS